MNPKAARRVVHPLAWWLWAIALAAAASHTLNPILLLAIIVVAGLVVVSRRTDAPWTAAFRAFVVMGVVALLVRVLFEILFGTPLPGQVLFTLPSVTLPDFMAGVRLGGPVTLTSIVAALYSGLQLVAIFACVGAANALANPTRLLKSVPGALYEVGVAVVVAVTLIPTALTHAQRVREARRLRGRSDKGLRAIAGISLTVLEGALERSLDLAAAMDSRGYGRMRAIPLRQRRVTSAMLLLGLLALIVGTYGLLDAETSAVLAFATIAVGVVIAVLGIRRANRRSIRTVYRPDPWRSAEWLTVVSGSVPAVAFIVADSVDPTLLFPSVTPLAWPSASLLLLAAVVVAAAPAWFTPQPPVVEQTDRVADRHVKLPERVAA